MHFVLTLHSHLPYVLNHGRWPHGSDWLCEAALDTYLPLLEALRALEGEGTRSPGDPRDHPGLGEPAGQPWVPERNGLPSSAQRLQACDEAPASLRDR